MSGINKAVFYVWVHVWEDESFLKKKHVSYDKMRELNIQEWCLW